MMLEIVECRCCGAKREYTYLANQIQRSHPCGCSPSRCFVSGKCIRHCPKNHPSCGDGDTPGSPTNRATFIYTYIRTGR
jgi:hypothetical protein